MTNPDLEQLVEVLAIKLSKLGYNAFDRDLRQVAQAILDAGYVKAEKVWEGIPFKNIDLSKSEALIELGDLDGKHIQVYVREVKE